MVLNVIVKNLRAGQELNRYRFWILIYYHVFVESRAIHSEPYRKALLTFLLTHASRIIHDLSYSPGQSVNDNTELSTQIEVDYSRAASIGSRILDVASAHKG